MKINFPLISGILILLLAGATYYGCHQSNRANDAEKQLEFSKVLKNPVAPLDHRFTDTLKQQHATFNNTLNNIGGKLVAVSKPLLDSVAKAAKTDPGNIINWQVIATTTEARALKAERERDSLSKRLFYSYRDKYVQLAYRPGSGVDSNDAGQFDFKYNADLTTTQYTKRKSFIGLPIGAKSTYTDIYSNDPRTTINGYKTFTIEQKQPTFGIRIQAVSAYSFEKKAVLVGMGTQFDIGRFSAVGSYYYNPRDNKLMPSVGLRYDIFR